MEQQQVSGGLIGVAVGDALGVPVEGISRAHLRQHPIADMQGYGQHHQPPGTWSDDSSLTFCTAESLINGLDLPDLAQRMLAWLRQGYWTPHGVAFDIGYTTREALSRLAEGVSPDQAGPASEWDNGNGALMRILPVAIRFSHLPLPELLDRAHRVSRVTHGHPRSQMACGIYVAIARRLLQGQPPLDAYRAAIAETSPYYEATAPFPAEAPHFARVLHGTLPHLTEDDIQSDGYVVHTLEASLWCLLTTDGFPQAVLKAVNLGGDSDTTGAVSGGLAGITYYLQGIPQAWVKALARHDDILSLAEHLYRSTV